MADLVELDAVACTPHSTHIDIECNPRNLEQTPEPLDDDEDKPGRGSAQVNPWTPSEDAR